MTAEVVNDKLKAVKFRGVKWDVAITPTLNSIQRFQFQAGANSEHNTFLAKTDGDKLIFTFGDVSSHGGEFVFASNNKEYKGYYYKISKGKFYSGKSPDDPTTQLLLPLVNNESNKFF